MNKNIILSITACVILLVGAIYLFSGNSDSPQNANNVTIKDGVQYVQIKVGGGYSPKVSTAKAGMPTKLVFNVGNAYDCSTSLSIKQLNYTKVLNPNSQEMEDAGTYKAGDKLQGVCAMGMYNFSVNFN
jgi:plastocyanin domain-containing protein